MPSASDPWFGHECELTGSSLYMTEVLRCHKHDVVAHVVVVSFTHMDLFQVVQSHGFISVALHSEFHFSLTYFQV